MSPDVTGNRVLSGSESSLCLLLCVKWEESSVTDSGLALLPERDQECGTAGHLLSALGPRNPLLLTQGCAILTRS